jgi:hypothetical protein
MPNNKFEMQVPDTVMLICQKLEAAGYPTFVVGGCVRDAIMGREPKDYDITTAASYDEICRVLAEDGIPLDIQNSKEHNICFMLIDCERCQLPADKSTGLRGRWEVFNLQIPARTYSIQPACFKTVVRK